MRDNNLILMNRIFLLGAFIALAGSFSVVNRAEASCYGTGYGRVCDGRGGLGSTYSPRGSNGSTLYTSPSGRQRRSTYNTFGNTRRTTTTFY